MGHLNVRFYVARAIEGLVGIAAAMGLPHAFRAGSLATLQLRDQHIRFMREARPRASLHMTAGLLELTLSEARLLQLLVHSESGEIAAAIQTRLAHVTAAEGREFPWPRRVHELSRDLFVSVPPHAAPRSLDLKPSAGTASLAAAERMDLIALSSGAVGAADCDAFGRMRPELVIGRISDGIPTLGARLGSRLGSNQEAPARMGGAVLEYRLAYMGWPVAGDRFVIRSGLVGLDDRTTRYVHWMLDPHSGRPWASTLAVAVGLDLDTRKIVPIDAEAQGRLRERITPGLAF